MPPRRRARAAKAPGSSPDVGELPPLPAGLRKETSQRTPLPTQYSTSYGSPVGTGGLSARRTMYGANVQQAAEDIFAAVRRENVDAAQARQEAVQQGQRPVIPVINEDDSTLLVEPGPEPEPEPEPIPPQNDNRARGSSLPADPVDSPTPAPRLPPTGPPSRPAGTRRIVRSFIEEAGLFKNGPSPGLPLAGLQSGGPTGTKQTTSTFIETGIPSGPPGTSRTVRSFIEEAGLFRDATMRTSEASSPAPTPPAPPPAPANNPAAQTSGASGSSRPHLASVNDPAAPLRANLAPSSGILPTQTRLTRGTGPSGATSRPLSSSPEATPKAFRATRATSEPRPDGPGVSPPRQIQRPPGDTGRDDPPLIQPTNFDPYGTKGYVPYPTIAGIGDRGNGGDLADSVPTAPLSGITRRRENAAVQRRQNPLTAALPAEGQGRGAPLPQGNPPTVGLRPSLQVLPEKAPFAPPEPAAEPNVFFDALNRPKHYLRACMTLTALLLLFLFWFKWSYYTIFPPEIWEGYVIPNKPRWYGWDDWRHNIGQLFPPVMPHPLSTISQEDWKLLRQFQGLRQDLAVQKESLDQLASILPSLVEMELDKNGKPVIRQSFWHALADLIREDGDILTFDHDKAGNLVISKDHWAALKLRFDSESVPRSPTASNTTALSVLEIEDIAQRTMSKSWGSWINANKKKVRELLEISDQDLPARLENKLVSQAESIMKDTIKANAPESIVATKEEFMKILRGHITDHKTDIQAELGELKSQVADMIKQGIAAADHPPTGLSREDVISIVDKAVGKKVKDLQLGAIAKGSIGANYDSVLQEQFNFFSLGNGAVVDPTHSSLTYGYDKRKPRRFSKEWRESFRILKDRPSSQNTLPHNTALQAWEDASDCWCAGAIGARNESLPVDLTILIGASIVPQNLVVEHISPTATFDPKAMPRDFEVWIQVEEESRRQLVDGFTTTHFPHHRFDHPLKYKGFHKVAEFTYEFSRARRGVHVHRLSEELLRIPAATDAVLVRAVNNHGSDHTCFYRLRLYGEIVDDE